MKHIEFNFENLSQALSRCGEKVANEAINEIKEAIVKAVAEGATVTDVDALLEPVQTTITAAQVIRRGKVAARRAAKKAAKEASHAEKSDTQRCGSLASRQSTGAKESDCSTYFNADMVKYLRRCPDNYMLAVLNSYVGVLLTGNVVNTVDDARYLNNFILMAQCAGIIHRDQQPTPEQAAAFFLDNPALPLPRAERRRLQRLRAKHQRSIR